MEQFAKRRRLYSSHHRDLPRQVFGQHDYYEESDELGMDVDLEDDEEGLEYDPHTELQHRRAELDYRLKNTFESIFAKYERDFDGIGDEIDLATGEIIVNNGHLIDMRDERDAGLRRDLVADSEGAVSSTEEDLSLGEEEGEEGGDDQDDEEEDDDNEDDEEDDEDEEDTMTGESMDDDDLILRGFTQANRFLPASPELGMTDETYMRSRIPRPLPKPKPKPRRSLQADVLPCHSDILAQFGPELGSQIVGYISQQENVRESHIEPAWRVPDLPSTVQDRRPIKPPFVRMREVERSPSPEASASVWAIPGMRKKRTSGLQGFSESAQSKRTRNGFTQEEDEAMLEYVAKARQNGTPLFSTLLWKGLEAKHPNHKWNVWQSRYKRKFYLSTDSDLSAAESSGNVARKAHGKNTLYANRPQEKYDRPTRDRKPAQKDSRIISWSQAVDTIASIDPDEHAGILDDARRSRNTEMGREMGWGSGPHWKSVERLQEPSLQRPVPTHEVDDLQHDLGGSRGYQSRLFDSQRISAPLPSGDQTRSKKPSSIPKVPCPHANCRHLTSNSYRLERLSHEDVSEMALHLFNQHQTTPFPCVELNCIQKGESGYFLAEDLIKHVKYTHPSVTAFQRLQGLVDPALLNGMKEKVCIDLTQDSPIVDKTASRQEDSDPVGTGNATLNYGVLSSTPGHDRTLTPVAFGERPGVAASVSTPLTSFSSIVVNRSPLSAQRREVGDSQEPPDRLNEKHDGKQSTQDKSVEPVFSSSRSRPFMQFPEAQTQQTSSDFIQDSPHNSSRKSATHMESHPKIPTTGLALAHHLHDEGSSMVANLFSAKSAESASTHNINKPFGNNNQASNSSLSAAVKNSKISPSESFTRNTVHPSHEFSEEEGDELPPRVMAPPQPAQPAQSMGELAISSSCLPVTPNFHRKARRSIVQKALDKDDNLDELSMGHDGFKILGSHTRSLPQPAFGLRSGIKREETVGPVLSSITTTRKRKFSDVEDADNIDELGADECFGKSTGTRIKKEVDLNATPMVHRIKAQRKQAKKTHRDEAKNGPMGLPPALSSSIMASRHIGRSGTPLLDLTPDKHGEYSHGGREILDSEDSVPSSALNRERHQPVSNAARSPLLGLLTPTRSKKGSLDPSKLTNTAIVIKTPGGTYRRCGEGAFRCGRSFCFRCGQSEATV